MFFSIGYFLWLKMVVDWDWYYWILGFSITVILLVLYFYGKKEAKPNLCENKDCKKYGMWHPNENCVKNE